MNLLIQVALLASYIAFGVWVYKNVYQFLWFAKYWVFENTKRTFNYLVLLIKSIELMLWRKYRLPLLKTMTRKGDKRALAERIARSNHKRRWSEKDKPYDY